MPLSHSFDVHAMIYSDNAPAPETMLHGYLSHKRLNMVNPRKEFFHVNLEDLEAFVKGKGLKIEFTKLAEAEEYVKQLLLDKSKRRRACRSPTSFRPICLRPLQDRTRCGCKRIVEAIYTLLKLTRHHSILLYRTIHSLP